MNIRVKELFERALGRRRGLLGDRGTTAVRLFHGTTEGLPGLVVERFGEVLIVQLHEGQLVAQQESLREGVSYLMQAVGARAAYLKHFVRDRAAGEDEVGGMHREATPWIGEAVGEAIQVLENGVRFVIRPYDGYSVGLFLEHRDNRRRVRELAAGKRVLNTFAYTCGFSVAAAAGGAGQVVSVDVSRRYLEWGKENFAANALRIEKHLFFAQDVREYLARAGRQGRKFDLVVLDPPTFGRVKKPKRTFVLEQELPVLLGEALGVLERGGRLLFATNCRGLEFGRIERALRDGAGGRKVSVAGKGGAGEDFAGDGGYSRMMWVQG